MKMRLSDDKPDNKVRLRGLRRRRIPGTRVDLPAPGRFRNVPTWLRYTLATALVAATFSLRMMFFGTTDELPFLLSFPCIIVCGYFFQHGTAYYATLLSVAYVTTIILPHEGPYLSFRAVDMIGVVMFIVSAVVSAYMVERLHDTMVDLLQANDKLVEVNIAIANEQSRNGMLLRENTHRMRNDLQRFASTLAMQRASTLSPQVKAAIGEAEARVVAMASLHGRLDNVFMGKNQDSVDSRSFLTGLMDDLLQSVAGRPIAVEVAMQAHPLPVPVAVAMGQIISELTANALKYAFPDGREGTVIAEFRREGDCFVLVVGDNGVGYDPEAPPRGTGLGRRLVRALSKHIRGEIDIVSSPASGTTCTLRLPATDIADKVAAHYATG